LDPRPVTDSPSLNIASQLSVTAARMPAAVAVAAPRRRGAGGRRRYDQLTFRQLDEDSNRIASALLARGMRPGSRMVLMVRPGLEFITLTFALFKAGAVVVLIDPGMGRVRLLDCLTQVDPDGFVAIPLAQFVRCCYRRRFPRARLNVTVGRRWWWRGPTERELKQDGNPAFPAARTSADDPAAIIFTTGSTGPPKGVLYRHGNFHHQVEQIRDRFGIAAGELDLPGFPLFALFNCAMGVTTVIPDMDPTRPARVDPRRIVEAVRDWQITQAFGSPAIWNAVGRYCDKHSVSLPTLRRVLSAGAPVPVHVLQRMQAAIASEGEIHTPYGATEALPVASISSREVLLETAPRTALGAGTCVGQRFTGITWKVIRISDRPLSEIRDAEELPCGEIGELIVQGPVVTTEYVTDPDANRLSKIRDGEGFWHRMGDVGYLDGQDRFWFCGRKAHRVQTVRGTMFTVPCEAIFNQHAAIYRSALVGLGRPGCQTPVIVAEPWPEQRPRGEAGRQRLLEELFQRGQQSPLTRSIDRDHILLHSSLPVDIRHNAKIFREQLAVWAASRLR
jgi:acyl-CoA synthetase (AMP-forming)/AMP-acid ligase II